ncbi:hypothetical protein K2173_004661 [Erythroxylum novogranatense]|uniref:SAM-dependent methyltransferase TRM5/TYW2-type domain-containing protein n=1 Tax=Erythroxylum novogranatense TaxID=1862640 RepID=A0AAV8T4W1_9ROSI|nr:hypothetical protein K2173_004661 [Erythroxylum novogranatense]
MEFEKRKAATLKSLGSSETDKSPKGTLDAPIIPLLITLNAHPSFFTTSSCSGRISILSQPKQHSSTPLTKKKARGGSWLFITHDHANPDSVVSLLFPNYISPAGELVFRFEPLIIAVECKDVESAQFLVSLAISSGFRESGITSAGKKRVIAGIRCSIRMEVPLGDSDNLLVSQEYVRFLVDVANRKMEANRKRTEGLLTVLRDNGFVGPETTPSENVNVASYCEDGIADKLGVSNCPFSVSRMVVVGEPTEKLFLWGHSACLLDREILVFGGFGGVGRHARRNEPLLLDPLSGTLKAVNVDVAPSSRLGHTASLVGHCVYIIGGRADPLNILNDVWMFDTAKHEWRLSEATGSAFPSRHRHAAAVVGSSIYVFGGLNNDIISSSLLVLNTETMQWNEVLASGDWPCARHSHAMVPYRSKIFMFGGYNGEKALGDLYSFDVQTCVWRKEKPAGRDPHARFSHSIFVYKNFIGVIGGCPVTQHVQELALLDLQLYLWRHVRIDYIGKELLVRSTTTIVGDELVVLGGGAACYAFGTKFSEPLKMNLLPLMSLKDKIIPLDIRTDHVSPVCDELKVEKNACHQDCQLESAEVAPQSCTFNSKPDKYELVASHWVIILQRKYAKLGKDTLKKLGWLDLGRKIYSQKDGLHVCFPITDKLHAVVLKMRHQFGDALGGQNDADMLRLFKKEFSSDEALCLMAFKLLKECGATILADEGIQIRKTAKSPLQIMKEAVASLIEHKGLPVDLLEQLPTRWEQLGDIVVLPVTSFKDPAWNAIGKELWSIIARSLNARRLARQGRIAQTGTRDSNLEILFGYDGWVDHRENGILYSFDATKCMFSWGNLSEKLRMSRLKCEDQVIVDLFAGIGYFVLPFLVRAKAKLVYACEWNPYAVEALKRNLQKNFVSDRCIVIEGDNRLTAPKGVADRVCLGLLPSSEASWVTAVRALRDDGGMLHVHGNVKDSEEVSWSQHVLRSIDEIAKLEGHCWEISIEHVERVKWYAPHIRHLVADVRCGLFHS